MVLLDHGGRHPSEVELLPAPPDLAHLVEHLSILGSHDPVTDWRVVADASPHLIASVTEVAGTRRLRTVVVGARTRAATVNVTNRTLTVCLRLRPGTLPLLRAASAHEFLDATVPIDNVFAPAALSDLELGHDAPQDVILRELLRLVRRASRSARAEPLVPRAGIGSVRELATWLQTPARSLRDRMRRETGLSPKQLLRLLRLHAALRAAWKQGMSGASRHRGSWSAIAYMAGYSDQAHLTREVRALLGETPSAWRARGSAVLFKTAPRV